MNATNGVFQSDMAKLVALKKTDEYPNTVEEAYRQASKYQSSVKISRPAQTVATTLMTKGEGKGGNKPGGKPAGKPNGKGTGSGKSDKKPGDLSNGKPKKYPCSTCSLLGLPDDTSHFPNNCPHPGRSPRS